MILQRQIRATLMKGNLIPVQRHSKKSCGRPRKEIKENEWSLEKVMKGITHTVRIMIWSARVIWSAGKTGDGSKSGIKG
jgi:hypothetical protein